MKKRLLVSGLFLLALAGCGKDSRSNHQPGDLHYFGSGSTEAILSFDFHVEIDSKTTPARSKIDDAMETQVTHLFGPMAAAKAYAVPKTDHAFSNVSEPKKIDKNLYSVDYHYKGTIVLKNGPKSHLEVILPYNPEKIYNAGLVGDKAPCTDAHYDSEGDFWYFWNPDQKGCPLKEGKDYERIQGDIERLDNTKRTYPEYDRLVRKENGEKVIRMMVFMGMDNGDNDHNPMNSDDENSATYKKIRKDLLKSGFESSDPLSLKQINAFLGSNLKRAPYYEELSRKDGDTTVIVGMFFGPTAMDENSTAFHRFYKKALEEASLVLYNGHSGLGGHLDLESIEKAEGFKIQPDQKHYQIYFFDSCSSYPYYNKMYFGRKKSADDRKGTKNLDILTDGLEAAFVSGYNSDITLLQAVAEWSEGKHTSSYQELIKKMDDDELLGINGDEDNPTTAP